ncbi:fasciclin domain-containing protein [Altibacter sp.]|uniref:fasciclin domain-containing protein n=1 Tax=Altibacter sp. TaxID=2024823 RepID=UPI0025872CB5|nr:fasciclin domain-containing protein [Altibacter sp.]MCW9037552.1 fasciclin domain-containing protein [Altibacter sp.]
MILKITAVLLLTTFFTLPVLSQNTLSKENPSVKTTWNDVTFDSEKTISENLALAGTFSETENILKEIESQVLKADAMVTVFVAEDAAYKALDKEEYKVLFASKTNLKNFFSYYVVPGRLDATTLRLAISKNGGTAYLNTVNGEQLGVKERDGNVILFDKQGNTATVTASNFYHANGFFHIISGLVFPATAK